MDRLIRNITTTKTKPQIPVKFTNLLCKNIHQIALNGSLDVLRNPRIITHPTDGSTSEYFYIEPHN